MAASLFVEHYAAGLAFYINGDLQFDTADEAQYHEYLAVPALALAVQRFPETPLRVLICGGGDGLAAREVLRFAEVDQLDLVDYSPEVLQLGRTVFRAYNHGSLDDARVTVYEQEAFSFAATAIAQTYHVIICDFTYPTRSEETEIYSQEWFEQIRRLLVPAGMMSTNGMSPENRTLGFWCLYQTLLAAGLLAKPLQLEIASFRQHDYGNWGFFLASPVPIHRDEIAEIQLPQGLQVLTLAQLLQSFVFDRAIARLRHQVTIHTLACPQLFYYLLNPDLRLESVATEADSLSESVGEPVDFLERQETVTAKVGSRDLLKLESAAQLWLEKITQAGSDTPPLDLAELLPVQHRYQTPKMTAEWTEYLKQLLAEVDLSRLLTTLLERVQELPPKVAKDLKELAEKIRSGQPLAKLPPSSVQLLVTLSVTLLMANLLTPDAAFAKGFSRSSSYGRSYSGSGSGSSSSGGESWKPLGFALTLFGGIWLYSLLVNRSSDE